MTIAYAFAFEIRQQIKSGVKTENRPGFVLALLSPFAEIFTPAHGSEALVSSIQSEGRSVTEAQQKQTRLASMRTQVPSPASLSGLRIPCCRELWSRSQTWLGSGVAVAVAQASGHSSNLTPGLGTSICRGCGPKKTKHKSIK